VFKNEKARGHIKELGNFLVVEKSVSRLQGRQCGGEVRNQNHRAWDACSKGGFIGEEKKRVISRKRVIQG